MCFSNRQKASEDPHHTLRITSYQPNNWFFFNSRCNWIPGFPQYFH